MKVVEKFYTVPETALLICLSTKTVIVKLKAGEFGADVLDLGSAARPDYRIPASGLNSYLEGRRIFSELPDLGIAARSEGELRRKVRTAPGIEQQQKAA